MRRRSTTAAAAAATAALALVAAGCGGGGGGGGGERLTLEEFVTQADAICAEYDKKFDDLGEPASQEELPDFIRRGQSLAEEQVAALRELSPPEDSQAKIDEAFAALDGQVDLFDDFASAAEDKDEAKMQEVSDKLDDLNKKADAVAVEIGLKECGSNG